jgi:hypothetical protein
VNLVLVASLAAAGLVAGWAQRAVIVRYTVPAGEPPLRSCPACGSAVTWYEDGTPAGGPDGAVGRIRDCERALLRAGFHVEYAAETSGGCLLAWRRTRGR